MDIIIHVWQPWLGEKGGGASQICRRLVSHLVIVQREMNRYPVERITERSLRNYKSIQNLRSLVKRKKIRLRGRNYLNAVPGFKNKSI